MSQVRKELHTLTLDDLTSTQIKTAVGKVYSDASQAGTQADAVNLVDAYRAVHVPTLGASIPGTGTISTASGVSVGDILTIHKPALGETYQLNAAQLANSGVSVLTASLVLTDGTNSVIISKVENQPAAQSNGFAVRAPFTYDNTVYLGAIVDAGTAPDADFSAASMKVVQ